MWGPRILAFRARAFPSVVWKLQGWACETADGATLNDLAASGAVAQASPDEMGAVAARGATPASRRSAGAVVVCMALGERCEREGQGWTRAAVPGSCSTG